MGIGTSHNRECRSNSWRHSVQNDQISTNISDEQVQGNVSRDVRENNEAESESDDKEVYIAEEAASTSRPLSEAKAKEMEEFRKHLAEKRQARKKILAERTNEMMDLKLQLEEERRLREELQNENKTLREVIADNKINPVENVTEQDEDQKESSDLRLAIEEMENRLTELHEQSKNIRKELAESNLSLQNTNTEMSLLNKENFELKNQIVSLKDVNSASKQVLTIRETQLTQLKEKLADIEKSLVDREMRTLSSDLRSEYERQLENIRNLRTLYEERARVAEVTRHNILKDLDDQKVIAEMQTKKCGELDARIAELEKELSDKNDIVGSTESQLGLSKAESKGLKAEMTVINQLISQMLLGYNNTQDLDKLLSKLEENHDLLADMVSREDCSDVASALPKLILDLVHQIDASEPQTSEELDEPDIASSDETVVGTSKTVTSGKEIVGNLPKVWRVLMELLSHQTGPPLIISEIHEKSSQNCYNSVDTPSGPRLVPSVSKTYIRLKDLILEKKSLQKEMNRLKQLNSHLESRHQDQERRLGMVSSELSKTWHVVGRMQRQHQQLHTHEKILRYELQQKRIMLTKLKVELEYCREKWDMAKLKNSQTQVEWEKLRSEFASRKLKSTESPNNSAESGYSDNERPSDDDSVTSNDADKTERKRLKKKGKENIDKDDEINIEEQNQAANESQSQNEDNDNPVDVLSDTEDQANMADTEDQSISESVKAEEEPTPDERDSTPVSEPSPSRSSGCYNEVLAARSARLRKLEEQCYVLVQKVAKTSNKGVKLCTRLEQLHNQYGGGSTEEPSTSTEQENCETDVVASLADTTCGDSQLNGIDTSTETLTEFNENTTQPDKESFSENEISCMTNAEDSNITEITNDGINDSELTDTTLKGEAVENVDVTEVLETKEGMEDISGKTVDEISPPSVPCSDQCTASKPSFVQDYEARFAARDVRLKRMEEQAKSLVNRVSSTSTRSVKICTKLEELHNTYGKSDDDSTESISDSVSDSQLPTTSDEAVSSNEATVDQTPSAPEISETTDHDAIVDSKNNEENT